MKKKIQIISAPSILGLEPGGVSRLPEAFLRSGLLSKMVTSSPVMQATFNEQYSYARDSQTQCLNPLAIRTFSLELAKQVRHQLDHNKFVLVLGGDCSVQLGPMLALKSLGKYGLIFIDAHADFYQPESSPTGQVADMDLALVTGRGPDLLTNIDDLKPYVSDEFVVHIGQRDEDEARQYGSRDVKDFDIRCFDLKYIRTNSMAYTVDTILEHISSLPVAGFWIHFDTDVIDDQENPAVDYRLPGGIRLTEVSLLLGKLLETERIVGMSVAIYNADLDADGLIAKNISDAINKAFEYKQSARL